MSDFMTPKQLAAKYPVSRTAIYAACTAGLLTHFRVPSRAGGSKGKYLIRLPDFLAWLEAHKHEAGASVPRPQPDVKPQGYKHLRL